MHALILSAVLSAAPCQGNVCQGPVVRSVERTVVVAQNVVARTTHRVRNFGCRTRCFVSRIVR